MLFVLITMAQTILLLRPASSTINPACECVIFDGFGYRSNGTFMSPNFPSPYPNERDCILYTFIGGEDEIVELSFDSFHLQEPEEYQNGRCMDFVKFFLELEKPSVNEKTKWQRLICGNQKVTAANPLRVYSKVRSLIFQFHADSYQSRDDIGFHGVFRFLKKSDFKSSGVKIPNTLCDFHVESSENLSRGKLFSPFYPYAPAPNSQCHYWLIARTGQRVRLTVLEISLPTRNHSCVDSQEHVGVYEGNGPIGSTFQTSDDVISKSHKIGHFCGQSAVPDTVITSGPYLFLEFHSGKTDQSLWKGFAAEFEFVEADDPPSHSLRMLDVQGTFINYPNRFAEADSFTNGILLNDHIQSSCCCVIVLMSIKNIYTNM